MRTMWMLHKKRIIVAIVAVAVLAALTPFAVMLLRGPVTPVNWDADAMMGGGAHYRPDWMDTWQIGREGAVEDFGQLVAKINSDWGYIDAAQEFGIDARSLGANFTSYVGNMIHNLDLMDYWNLMHNLYFNHIDGFGGVSVMNPMGAWWFAEIWAPYAARAGYIPSVAYVAELFDNDMYNYMFYVPQAEMDILAQWHNATHIHTANLTFDGIGITLGEIDVGLMKHYVEDTHHYGLDRFFSTAYSLDNILIDLRDSSGVFTSFFDNTIQNRLDASGFEGKVWVLINEFTMDAANIVASRLADNGATLVGTHSAPSARSASTQGFFQLPNSGLVIGYSTHAATNAAGEAIGLGIAPHYEAEDARTAAIYRINQ